MSINWKFCSPKCQGRQINKGIIIINIGQNRYEIRPLNLVMLFQLPFLYHLYISTVHVGKKFQLMHAEYWAVGTYIPSITNYLFCFFHPFFCFFLFFFVFFSNINFWAIFLILTLILQKMLRIMLKCRFLPTNF